MPTFLRVVCKDKGRATTQRGERVGGAKEVSSPRLGELQAQDDLLERESRRRFV